MFGAGLIAVDPAFHQRAAGFRAVRLDLQLSDDLWNRPAFGGKLAGTRHPSVVDVLLAGLRAGEPIGAVDPGLQAKELVTGGALPEWPAAMHCGRQLANHGTQQAAGTEDQLRPTFRLRPNHAGA